MAAWARSIFCRAETINNDPGIAERRGLAGDEGFTDDDGNAGGREALGGALCGPMPGRVGGRNEMPPRARFTADASGVRDGSGGGMRLS
jgi:hypothetical protein